MFIFGHVGITLGVGLLVNRVIAAKTQPGLATAPAPGNITGREKKQDFSVSDGLDLRFLMVGSMLPDVIDKPIGIFIFGSTLSNGRIFSHTLLFLFLLTLAGICLLRYRKTGWLLAIVAGVFLHLVLDEMWWDPVTLLWPALGIEFATRNVRDWVSEMLLALTHNPKVYVSEIIGFAIIMCFLVVLIMRDRIMDFLLAGRYDFRVKRQSRQ